MVQGVSNDELTGQGGPLSHVELSKRVEALNKLLRTGKVALFKQGAHLLYKAAQTPDTRCVIYMPVPSSDYAPGTTIVQ